MNRVRAIILDNDQIVVIKREKPNDIYWVFPGGGVEPDDQDLESAIKRECIEELGINVIVNDLFVKQEFNGSMEYFYICHISSGKLGTGKGPEYQEGFGYEGTHVVEQIELSQLNELNLKPEEVRLKVISKFCN